ncbi:MAG: lipopolysaccharide kinase InaA family protein [Gammaproteobacteria bacterium]|nr:lipopolysaccharide kinase InaA family protein [Gammaproteobacteria bacterium]
MRARYRWGKLLINADLAYHDAVLQFIRECRFEQVENPGNLMPGAGPRRNALYEFEFPAAGKTLILKITQIHPGYKFLRRLEMFLFGMLRDYNRDAFFGALAIEGAGVKTSRAVAHWNAHRFSFRRKSYFLYEKVEADTDLSEYKNSVLTGSDTQSHLILESLIGKVAEIARTLHAQAIRHGDLIGRNVLLNFANAETDIALIDTDGYSRAYVRIPFIKRFFDLRDIADTDIDPTGRRHFLQLYLGEDYREIWWKVLKFWFYGGFNFSKRRHRRREDIQNTAARPRRK